MLSLRPACGEKVAEGRMRGRRLCAKQRWIMPGHPLTRPCRGTLSRKRARGMLSLRPACGEKVAEGRMRGRRLRVKQRWNMSRHPLTRPCRGTLSRKRERESKRCSCFAMTNIFMLIDLPRPAPRVAIRPAGIPT
ncbi:hypothetical protein AGMMS50256_23370 [Betaproteobacteria bacterium]|nr:hypothetical protein AGMMS50256_23370 [Betaproteobacteria bacterium]